MKNFFILSLLTLMLVVTAFKHLSTDASLARLRTSLVLAVDNSGIEGDATGIDQPARKKPPSWRRSVYDDEELKLKSVQFDVNVPSNVNIKLTENEKRMIARKEEAEAAARELQGNLDDSAKTMSDADILKAEMKAMLDRMRSKEASHTNEK